MFTEKAAWDIAVAAYKVKILFAKYKIAARHRTLPFSVFRNQWSGYRRFLVLLLILYMQHRWTTV